MSLKTFEHKYMLIGWLSYSPPLHDRIVPWVASDSYLGYYQPKPLQTYTRYEVLGFADTPKEILALRDGFAKNKQYTEFRIIEVREWTD